jgi:dCTP deaminase
MEISNHARSTIMLPVGIRICQIKFEYVGPTLREYHGKYGQARQWTPEDMLPKLYADWDVAELGQFQQHVDGAAVSAGTQQ